MELHLNNSQNGSVESNQILNSTLYNGAFLELSANVSMEEMRDTALQVLYSQLLIPAWSQTAIAANLGNTYPAIL